LNRTLKEIFMHANLQELRSTVSQALAEMRADEVIPRIWEHDHTVWAEEPTEITNRLDWLTIAEEMQANITDIEEFVNEAREDGFSHVLLLGMGGSSLAPEVFSRTFGTASDYLTLGIVDSTDPGWLYQCTDELDPKTTLFIVATKSGGTVETLSAFKFFYNWVAEAIGAEHAGEHFVAITDPGSKLLDIADQYHFRQVFQNNPNIGGRYSALSYFGLVPAALLGVSLERLLASAQRAMGTSRTHEGVAAQLGVIMGEFAKVGRDKLTLILPGEFESLGDWIEQLVAESTGKNGVGILPVVGEPLSSPEAYGDDRLFVALTLSKEQADELQPLADAGHPIVILPVRDSYDIGSQFIIWEMATVVAGYRMGIQPFDQPNVEAAKIIAREMVAAYHKDGKLPEGESAPFSVDAFQDFLSSAQPGDYVSLHAYVTPTPDTSAALQALRLKIREQTKTAVTIGYGPRFLHSTGQLHKGDGGNGLFVQFTSGTERDADIPDEAGSDESTMSFNVLKLAQALGDYEALKSAEPARRVIRFHLDGDVVESIIKLI
jgi:glucose-6-phosphate isomerase